MDASNARGRTMDRQELTVGYSMQVNDQFTFSPKVTMRHNSYPGQDTRNTEWRIFPNMSYALNDRFALLLYPHALRLAAMTPLTLTIVLIARIITMSWIFVCKPI